MSAENQNIRILLVESWRQQNFNISFEIINSVVVLKIFTKFESWGCFQSWIIQVLIAMTSSKWRKKKVFLKILKMRKSKNICKDGTFFSIIIRFFWAITELFLKCNESNILTCLYCVEAINVGCKFRDRGSIPSMWSLGKSASWLIWTTA